MDNKWIKGFIPAIYEEKATSVQKRILEKFGVLLRTVECSPVRMSELYDFSKQDPPQNFILTTKNMTDEDKITYTNQDTTCTDDKNLNNLEHLNNIKNNNKNTELDVKTIINKSDKEINIKHELIVPKDSECVKIKISIPKTLPSAQKQLESIQMPVKTCVRTTPEHRTKLDSPLDKNDAFFKQSKRDSLPPIMGKKALLSKATHSTKEEENDSKIVQELVLERYNNILNTLTQKSFHRQLCRKASLDFDEENSEPEEQTILFDDGSFFEESYGLQKEQLFLSIEEIQHLNEADFDSNGNILSSTIDSNLDSKDSPQITNPLKTELKDKQDDFGSQNKFGSNGNFLSSTIDPVLDNDETCLMLSPLKSGSQDNKQEFQEDEVEYDSRTFLEMALGENNLSTASEISFSLDSSTPDSKITDQQKNIDETVNTSNISTLLSLYSEVNKNQSGNIHKPSAPHLNYTETTENSYEVCFPNFKADSLIYEKQLQNEIILQTSKALNVCENTKEFHGSTEHLEAEKILLLATERKNQIHQQLKTLEYESIDFKPSKNLGWVKITNLNFPIKTKTEKNYLQYFVCILQSGSLIFSTSVQKAVSGKLEFNEEFIFDQLTPDFEINVSIYCMRVKSNLRNYSHESKFHLNKIGSTMCPKPQKLFNLHKFKRSTNFSYLERKPLFLPHGRTTLRMSNLDCTQHKLNNIPQNTLLYGIFTATPTSGVVIGESKCGFLNIGLIKNGTPIWNRRWVVLKGTTLKYWNYPGQELETPPAPMGCIHLSKCLNKTISSVSWNICSRARTLLVELRNDCDVIRQVFLSADTIEDMRDWERCLNSVVCALSSWNALL